MIFLSGCGKKQVVQNNQTIDSSIQTQKLLIDINTVSTENLPQCIKDFVELNYKGYEITDVSSDPLCQGGDAIDVTIEKEGQTPYSLIFKPDCTYVQKEEDMPVDSVPVKVKEILRMKYSNYLISDEIEKIVLADNTPQYLIDLQKDTTYIEVLFTPDGLIVCED
jgi:hypothetical protein